MASLPDRPINYHVVSSSVFWNDGENRVVYSSDLSGTGKNVSEDGSQGVRTDRTTGTGPTDQELIEQVRRGEKEAFRAIVERYEPVVAATVRGMLGPGHEAEDVGQETFIRFYRAIESFRGDSSLKTYLTRIAINLSLNELKRRKRRSGRIVPEPVEDLPIGGGDDRANLDRNELQELVRRGLVQLDEKHRAVVLLRMIEGFSTAETAGILGLPEGTVLSRLSRGMKKLEEILRPWVTEEEFSQVETDE